MKKIFIDPGHNHSGKDTGAYGLSLKEEDITFYIAERLAHKLSRAGFKIKMSRNALTDNCKNTSVGESLRHRCDMANNWGADLFVSIHCNSSDPAGTGTETYAAVYGSKSYKIAQCIQRKVVERTGLSNRGVKTARYTVLTETDMPAVLVETAFINKVQDAEILKSAAGRDRIATGIAEGVADYLGLNINFEEEIGLGQYEELKELIENQNTEITNLLETIKKMASELSECRARLASYNWIDKNMPEYAIDSVTKLIEAGALTGTEKGLDLTQDMLRIFVILDRLGLIKQEGK